MQANDQVLLIQYETIDELCNTHHNIKYKKGVIIKPINYKPRSHDSSCECQICKHPKKYLVLFEDEVSKYKEHELYRITERNDQEISEFKKWICLFIKHHRCIKISTASKLIELQFYTNTQNPDYNKLLDLQPEDYKFVVDYYKNNLPKSPLPIVKIIGEDYHDETCTACIIL